MKTKTATLGLVFILAACASQPDDLPTTYISPLKYQDYNCKQLAMEMDHISRRTTALYMSLDKKADRDAAQVAGGILLWPFLFGLEGGDGPEATEYSTLKGEYEAVRQTMVSKSCALDNIPPSPEETAQKIREREEAEAAARRERNRR